MMGYGDGADSVDFGGMVDKMADEYHIDRDEAVKRLGALLQRQTKRVRIHGKQECKNSAAMCVALFLPNVGPSDWPPEEAAWG